MKNIYAIIIALLIFLFPSRAQEVKTSEDAQLVASNQNASNGVTTIRLTHTESNRYASRIPPVETQRIVLMPNAKTGDIKILFKYDKTATASISVKDEKGKVVLLQEATLQSGKNVINVDHFKDLPAGTYLVALACDQQHYQSTFIRW